MRTYKPVQKKKFACACNCGKVREGNKNAQYYNAQCRLRAWLRRKRENAELQS